MKKVFNFLTSEISLAFICGNVFFALIFIISKQDFEIHSDLLKNWQTLIAGMIAFIGAVITTGVLIHQVNFEKKKHFEQKEIDKFYYKAQLSNALRELIDFLNQIFLSFEKEEYIIPPEPLKALEIFYLNLKHAEIDTAKNLKKIADDYQICMSRIKQYKEDTAINKNEYSYYYLSLVSHYFAILFNYARGDEDKVIKIEPSKKKLEDGFKYLVGIDKYHREQLHHNKYNNILEQIERTRAFKYEKGIKNEQD